MEKISNQIKAGFWIRALATWIDLLLVYVVLKLLFYLLFAFSVFIYFPFQFTFFILLVLYSAAAVAVTGQTVGKWLLNLGVCNTKGEKLSFSRSLFRESVAKILSAIVLSLGFFWVGFTRKKRGWHDYLAGSTVTKEAHATKRVVIWRTAAILSFMVLSVSYLGEVIPGIYYSSKMAIPAAKLDLPFLHRSASKLIEVSAIKQDSLFTSWIRENGKSPETYLIDIAAKHKVTLLGEMHGVKENLVFFNGVIPDLYYKSGVRCIGMEVMPACMNGSIKKLVNSRQYDEKRAMEIARSQPWRGWGDKEYWDVLKTVWALNRNLPPNAPKMRLIGLDGNWEGPNIGLLNIGGDKKGPTPFMEKFRAVPAIKAILIATSREGIMANNIEQEMINKGDKGIALVGFAHTMPQLGRLLIKNDKVIAVQQRMGMLLGQKYKDDIFQVELFQTMDPEVEDKAHPPLMQHFIESVIDKSAAGGVGFTIKNSPFEFTRDSYSAYFEFYPSVCYGDLAKGLIYLKPITKLTACTWAGGYVSDKMYMKYKPFYELVTKQKFTNAKEVNEYFRKKPLEH
jgi:uncharacterized RDD family membrane protein YckC